MEFPGRGWMTAQGAAHTSAQATRISVGLSPCKKSWNLSLCGKETFLECQISFTPTFCKCLKSKARYPKEATVTWNLELNVPSVLFTWTVFKPTQKGRTMTQGVPEAQEISWNHESTKPETIPPSLCRVSNQVHVGSPGYWNPSKDSNTSYSVPNHQLCSLLDQPLPCWPLWVFVISETLQIKALGRLTNPTLCEHCPCLDHIKLTDTPWSKNPPCVPP